MTAEDARRSVDALSQLLRDEVAEAMGDGMSERPVWLPAGEQLLARAARATGPNDFARSDFAGSISESRRLWRTARARGWLVAALVAGGIGLGASLVALQDRAHTEGPALTFQVQEDGASARHAGRVIAPADRAEEVRFSDGSRFTLTAGSMLRVRETDAHGAMVIVEEGQVDSNVQHLGQARWSVFAGPYEVRVVGTRFRTAWDPGRQRLSVVLHEGTVQVLGKGIAELVELKPGQRFESGGTEGTWFVTATADPALAGGGATEGSAIAGSAVAGSAIAGSAIAGSAVAGSATGAASEPGATDDRRLGEGSSGEGSSGEGSGFGRAAFGQASSGRPRGGAPAGESWSTLVASGKFEEVLDEASIRGEAACLSSCSVADLRALADAARYTGRFSLAERTLARLRSAAPSEAPRAGFLLGSMNEAQGRPSAALEWYGRYLAEAPSGALVAEARAGRMRALLALGQTEAAKAAARDYLRLHPAGVGAAGARQILLRP